MSHTTVLCIHSNVHGVQAAPVSTAASITIASERQAVVFSLLQVAMQCCAAAGSGCTLTGKAARIWKGSQHIFVVHRLWQCTLTGKAASPLQ
jgi:hypothetical protein